MLDTYAMTPIFRFLPFLVALHPAVADETPNASESPVSLVRASPAEALKRLQAMDGQARYRELAAMSFDAYCDWVVRVSPELRTLGDKKCEIACYLCCSRFANPHGATLIWNYDDPRAVRVKRAVVDALEPEREREVERQLGRYGKLQLARRMASGNFRGDIAFFRLRSAATQEQFEEYMAALDGWESAMVDSFARIRALKPDPLAMPHEEEEGRKLLHRRLTKKAVGRWELARFHDVSYSREQACQLNDRAWKAFLAYWRAQANPEGKRMTDEELAAALEQGFKINREEAVALLVPSDENILALWNRHRRTGRPWQDELEAMFREEKNMRSENVSKGGER